MLCYREREAGRVLAVETDVDNYVPLVFLLLCWRGLVSQVKPQLEVHQPLESWRCATCTVHSSSIILFIERFQTVIISPINFIFPLRTAHTWDIQIRLKEEDKFQ